LLRKRFLRINIVYLVIVSPLAYDWPCNDAVALAETPPFSAPTNTPLSSR
jgi:hypothetical protein